MGRRFLSGLVMTVVTSFSASCDKVDLSGTALVEISGCLDVHLTDIDAYYDKKTKVQHRDAIVRIDPSCLDVKDWQLQAVSIDPNKGFALSRTYHETSGGFDLDLAPIPSNIGFFLPVLPKSDKEYVSGLFTIYKAKKYGENSRDLTYGFDNACSSSEIDELLGFCEEQGLPCYVASGAGIKFILLPKEEVNGFSPGDLVREICDDDFFYNTLLIREPLESVKDTGDTGLRDSADNRAELVQEPSLTIPQLHELLQRDRDAIYFGTLPN